MQRFVRDTQDELVVADVDCAVDQPCIECLSSSGAGCGGKVDQFIFEWLNFE